MVRKAEDFNLARLVNPPKAPISTTLAVWTLSDIFAARDQQLQGRFRLPARLAEAMRTDDALAVAYEGRLDPQRCIAVDIVPAAGSRGKKVAVEADALFGASGIGIRPETLADINGCLANHGLAIGLVEAVPRDDGSRVDFFLKFWPIEHVRWDPYQRALLTLVDSGGEEEIVHGDGRWVVFAKHEWEPWKQEAAILPAAAVWARHAYGNRDWAKGSVAHGNAKLIGELPENVPLQDGDGNLTPEAEAMITLLRDMATSDTPVGIRPAGAKTEFVTNSSSAWQVWEKLVDGAEKAAARIYLGTDGILGTRGGAPGVDIEALFGVAATKVEGDLLAIERGIYEGVIVPWCAVNFGDSSLAPTRKYRIPDRDSDAARESAHKRRLEYLDVIAKMKESGLSVDQATADALAEEYGVTPIVIPPEKVEVGGIVLAPTDLAKVITVNEARASLSLPPLDGPDGDLPMAVYVEKAMAALTSPTPVAPAPAAEPATAPPPVDVPAALALSALERMSGAIEKLGARREPAQVEPPFAARHAAYLADIREMKIQKLHVDEGVLRKLAELHGIPALGVKDGDDDLQ